MTTTATSTPTRQRRIDEISDETRKRILDAAEELFAEKGFDKTSFVDISHRSGISRGSIPWHFKNKDGLLIAVVERHNQRFLAPDHFSERPALREILAQYELMASDSRGRLMFTILNEALSSSSEIHDEYRGHYREQRRRVAHWLKVMGVESAKERSALAMAIVGAISGITMHYHVDPEDVDLAAAFRAVATIVEAHLPT